MTEIPTIERINAFKAEEEAIETAIDQLARAVHKARGNDPWAIDPRWGRCRHPYIIDGWSVWSNKLSVSYCDHSQSPDGFTVDIPLHYLEPGYDWRAGIAAELERRNDEQTAAEERAARMLV